MNISDYIGHPTQLCRIEEHQLVGGRGDNMRLIEIDNGRGLALTLSPDRCGDISRMSYRGINLGFFAPCGYVSPHYYDGSGNNFLKSFTAGFMTTCGLSHLGSPCQDDGEELGLHGTIAGIPAEEENHWIDGGELVVRMTMRDASLFARKLLLKREYRISTLRCEVTIHDHVENFGHETTPYMILYHINFGYPLLAPDSIIELSAKSTAPSDDVSRDGLPEMLRLCEPRDRYPEQCFYHEPESGHVSLSNRGLGVSVSVDFDLDELPCLTQWKLMQKGEYVLGLEPGNCFPNGRDKMRESGRLRFLAPGESAEQTLKISIREI